MVTDIDKSEAGVLFGKSCRAILTLLFTNSDQAFYLREIVRLSGIGIGSVQRELKRLTSSGIIERYREGKQVYFRADQSSPIYEELRSIIVKTVGLGDVIKSSLKPLADKIDYAFIYGSFAKGTDVQSSDVDLMVIGDVKHRDVVRAISIAQKELNREINPSVYTRRDFVNRIGDRNTFISTVMKSKKIIIIGDSNELEILG